MSLELTGTIKKIGEIQTFSSGFQKREVVIVTEEQYPQPINIELLSDKVDIIEPFKEGESVVVGINLRGREWVSPNGETKYFNSIVAWKLTRPANQEPANNKSQAAASTDNPFQEEDDDLPF